MWLCGADGQTSTILDRHVHTCCDKESSKDQRPLVLQEGAPSCLLGLHMRNVYFLLSYMMGSATAKKTYTAHLRLKRKGRHSFPCH